MTTAPAVSLDGVTWTYPNNTHPTLESINLAIAPGEFVVLCGASGSGKSTALRVMNGLIPHFYADGTLRGSARTSGMETSSVELAQLGGITGTVLQHPRKQFFADRVAPEIAFAMENFGYPSEQIQSRVDVALSALAPHLPVGQSLGRLSGGQQQQVSIAAASAHEPLVLLLDEPSSNLSIDAVQRLVETLRGLKEQGTTLVIAEHRLHYLTELLDRVIVFRSGTIARAWTAEQFRQLADDELALEGLRGELRTAHLPEIWARGSSVAQHEPASSAAASAGTGLELIGIRCRFAGRTVLDIAYARFPAAAVTAVRGVNGAGKSTLARVIAGLQRCAGDVLFDGKAMSRRARQQACGIVMQDVQRQLFAETVSEEITSAYAAGNVAESRNVLQELDLLEVADRHPLSLSGGQQQRLVIASVRVGQHSIIIFDEPSSGVDRRHLQSISDQIRSAADTGAVVILISHDEDLLALAADAQLTLRRQE
ncbi:MAG: ABC transporter ATP-binding protein [Leucobacter sp.]|jgi:energy-coupling factor transport system ATP-binding protein|nr:ABC transporter ATP-binding protein [Leucobacter sp.]